MFVDLTGVAPRIRKRDAVTAIPERLHPTGSHRPWSRIYATHVISGWAAGILVALAAVVATSTPAAAHAGLVTASPTPGSTLPQAPGSVSLRFSEPFDRRLSRLEVIDRSGRDVGVGRTHATPRQGRIRVEGPEPVRNRLEGPDHALVMADETPGERPFLSGRRTLAHRLA